MPIDKLTLAWARKLLRSRNYVILTDTESVVNLRSLHLDNFDDALLVSSHLTALENIKERVEEVMRLYDAKLQERQGRKAKRTKGGK